MSTQTDIPPVPGPVFASILCGVDGSRPSLEAARQAAVLAGPDTALTYTALTWEQGTGATAMATLSHKRADAALADARDIARELGAAPAIVGYDAQHPAERLAELAARSRPSRRRDPRPLTRRRDPDRERRDRAAPSLADSRARCPVTHWRLRLPRPDSRRQRRLGAR